MAHNYHLTQTGPEVQELLDKIKLATTDEPGLMSAEDKVALDSLVENAYVKPDTGIPKTDLSSGVQTSLNKADTALQEHQDISGKADKVSGATAGDFAGLDSNGNLTDSGSKASDFATAEQGAKADSAYQKPNDGIPASDMAQAVQTSLGKADTAYQKPVDGIPSSDLADGVIPDVSGKEDASNKVTSLSAQSTDTQYPSAKLVYDQLASKQDTIDAQHKLDYSLIANTPDLSDFITKTVNDLVYYYKKSETYTKAQVDDLISGVASMSFVVADSLPSAGAETMGKIYLIPSADPAQRNVKDEFITIDNGDGAVPRYTWEQIGSTAVDLSGYATTQDLNDAVADVVRYTVQSLTAEQKAQARSNIGAGTGDAEFFEINRQTTTGAEIKAAYDAGKILRFKALQSTGIYVYEDLAYFKDGGNYYEFWFSSVQDSRIRTDIYDSRYDEWMTTFENVSAKEEKSNKVTSWSNVPTNVNYPSEKLVKNSLDAKYTKPSEGIPASDLASGVIPDVSNFITNSVDNLVNYYLKSETYTKGEVEGLIAAISQFHYEIYASTSAVTSPANNVLYLIGPTGSGADKYEEYVYANNTWTKIGDTSVDLSGYVTTSALNTALADYTTTANLTTLLADKADKSEMSVTDGTGANADKTTITLKSGTSATVLKSHQDISGKENTSNRRTSWQTTPDDTHYPSEKLVKDSLDQKYQKPSGGIPETDLANAVKEKLVSSGVFVATPSVSTFSEIKTAYNAGKAVIALGNSGVFLLSSIASSYCYLSNINRTVAQFYVVQPSGWTLGQASLELISNKKGTIAGNKSSDSYYPTTKAVYDEVHPAIQTTQPQGGFLPNVEYNLGTLTGNVTFALASAVSGIGNKWYWCFTAGSTAPTIQWPTGLLWPEPDAEPPTIEANDEVEVEVKNGHIVALVFKPTS